MIRYTIAVFGAILFFSLPASAEYKHLNPDNTEVAPNRPPVDSKKPPAQAQEEFNLDSMSQVSALLQGKQAGRPVGEQRGPESMPPMAPFR